MKGLLCVLVGCLCSWAPQLSSSLCTDLTVPLGTRWLYCYLWALRSAVHLAIQSCICPLHTAELLAMAPCYPESVNSLIQTYPDF